ncbi:hypothetical protein CR513_31737, partial [Mucuna pruriens]
MSTLLEKYRMVHRMAIVYHPQTNRQAKVFNREIKQILQKVAHANRKNWNQLLEDSLWAHRMAYQTSLGISPYQIVFCKACHLLVEIKHRAYWAVKRCNLVFNQASKERKFKLQELEELRLESYENSKIYKKNWAFNSCLKLIVGKLRSKSDGPFIIINVFPYGAIEIRNETTNKTFKVNGHQLKLFHECLTMIEGDVEDLSLVKSSLSE